MRGTMKIKLTTRARCNACNDPTTIGHTCAATKTKNTPAAEADRRTQDAIPLRSSTTTHLAAIDLEECAKDALAFPRESAEDE